MAETIFIWILIALCAFLVGRKFYRQYRSALHPDSSTGCGCECSGCSVSDCGDSDKTIQKQPPGRHH